MTKRKAVLDFYKMLRDSHLWERELIERHAFERMYRFFSDAKTNVQYYQERIPDLGNVHSYGELREIIKKIPILERGDLVLNKEDMISSITGDNIFWNKSGGSTGNPVEFLQDQDYNNWSFANKILFLTWTGYVPGERHVKIWGAKRDNSYDGSKIRQWVHENIMGEKIFSCYETSTKIWKDYLHEIDGLRPSVIESYVEAIYECSCTMIREGIGCHKPNGIITSAGVLSQDMKKTIEKAWNCIVLNRYGSREVGDIACSCKKSDNLHVSELTHFVEIVGENGEECVEGEVGDILVTLITNNTMPIIRYRIGDRAAWSHEGCECGRNTKRLKSIAGRSNDYLFGDGRKKVFGATTAMHLIDGIKQYQIVQDKTGKIIIKILPWENISEEAMSSQTKKAANKLKGFLGEKTKVNVQIVDSLELGPTGKHRFIINNMIKNQ